MVVVLLLLISGVATGKSSMLFQAGKNELEGVSCLPGLSTAALQDMVTDMSSLPSIMDRLLPNILVQRVSGTSGNARVREFIKDEMRSLGWLVEEDTFRDRTPFGVVTFSNIIATMNPQATKRLVIACHYDSKYMPGSVPFVGASDSAVPCSIMMDTARQLNRISKYMQNPAQDITLQLIFFDGEEAFVRWTFFDSLYGSRHLASLWESSPDGNDPMAANNLANIDFFVLLDLIGTSDTRFVNYYSNTSQLFHQLVSIEQCLKTNKLLSRKSSRAIFNPLGRAQIVEDDHIPFINRGVRVLHLISTPFPRVWHTVYDNLSYLDTALIDDFSRILRIFLTSVLYRI